MNADRQGQTFAAVCDFMRGREKRKPRRRPGKAARVPGPSSTPQFRGITNRRRR